jgi:hypothetical protein
MLSLSPAPVYDGDCRGAAGLLAPEPAADWLRCEDVRGGGMGPLGARVPADAAKAGDGFVDGGRVWTRGVLSIELLAMAEEW